MPKDPIELEGERGQLLAQLGELRRAVAELSDGYAALPESGLIIDTVGAEMKRRQFGRSVRSSAGAGS
ncbi:hypothetical protein OG308_18100 [Nocardia salmonicida]|uniref:Transposase n=1 Tax=Nocardia salmonicida TaxID=53431 RepID=A0ABZ1N008_9NOCA